MSWYGRLKERLWWVPFGRVPEISAFELNERLSGNHPPQLVDVRSGAEWRRSHIEGAINVPIQELRARTPELQLDPGRPVVAICLTAHRSIPAVRLLRARGFDDAVQLQGGMLAWWREAFPARSARGQR
jgi:rhodanese-related sulfurtransferase